MDDFVDWLDPIFSDCGYFSSFMFGVVLEFSTINRDRFFLKFF